MTQEVQYHGYSAQPSDFECPDGSLDAAINIYPGKSGSMIPACHPALNLKLPSSCSVRYIHQVQPADNYIIFDSATDSILWLDTSSVIPDSKTPKEPPSSILHIGSGSNLYSITSIGNTLMILTSTGMHYILWKGGEAGYSNLGIHLPELPLKFGLHSLFESVHISVNLPEQKVIGRLDHSGNLLSDANKEAMTSQVLAAVNKFIAEKSIENSRFIFPFFVRYALRLFDGSLTMHSAPVLMLTTTGNTPEAHWDNLPSSGGFSGGPVTIFAHTHALAFSVISQDAIDAIKEWGDIVKSVDIFISAPIYSYDQSGAIELFSVSRPAIPYSLSKLTVKTAGGHDTISPYYKKNTIEPGLYNNFIDIPYREAGKITSDIKSCAHFYLVKSIPVESLSPYMSDINIDKGVLSSLTAREVMTDDYDSHHVNIPKVAYAYNSRLNLADIMRSYFRGYHPLSLFCYCNSMSYSGVSSSSGSWGSTSGDRGTGSSNADSSLMPSEGSRAQTESSEVTAYICVYIKHDNKEICVSSTSSVFDSDTPIRYFYYPDTKAHKAIIVFKSPSGATACYEIKLQPHDFLNGAYYYGTDEIGETGSVAPSPTQPDYLVPLRNKLYTSEVNNPFSFPLLGISTIGSGVIIGLATAAKALSQGQFGQFPLYAFTTEGVWALEVSSTGTFSTRQPVTRDVCINPDGITQIDSAVLFPTDRGIMLISGSAVSCISDDIYTRYPFEISSLPFSGSLASLAGLSPDDISILPFPRFLEKSAMVYDYAGQRVILYNPECTYAYLYSIDSRRWGMMQCDITSSVNAWQKALVTDSAGRLLDYSLSVSGPARRPQLLVTRPLKLNAPHLLKTVDSVIQRGNFSKGHVMSVLYGSRDLINWQLVWSSKDRFLRGFSGSPYKYFRIALICNLSPEESIYGASVCFTPRLGNRPR